MNTRFPGTECENRVQDLIFGKWYLPHPLHHGIRLWNRDKGIQVELTELSAITGPKMYWQNFKRSFLPSCLSIYRSIEFGCLICAVFGGTALSEELRISKFPYVYYFTTQFCWQQAEVICNHEKGTVHRVNSNEAWTGRLWSLMPLWWLTGRCGESWVR